MMKFGDIIHYNDEYYIYLADKGDSYTYYFAKIISDEERKCRCIHYKDLNKGTLTHKISDDNTRKVITCFTILTTDDFEDDLAHFGKPERSEVITLDMFDCSGRIEKEDAENLKKDIIGNDDVLPKALVKKIKELI